MNLIPNAHDTEADLVCEALVREIARGPRWKAVVEAWQALLVVRRMSERMAKERATTQQTNDNAAIGSAPLQQDKYSLNQGQQGEADAERVRAALSDLGVKSR